MSSREKNIVSSSKSLLKSTSKYRLLTKDHGLQSPTPNFGDHDTSNSKIFDKDPTSRKIDVIGRLITANLGAGPKPSARKLIKDSNSYKNLDLTEPKPCHSGSKHFLRPKKIISAHATAQDQASLTSNSEAPSKYTIEYYKNLFDSELINKR
jgi:hypothetical protein